MFSQTRNRAIFALIVANVIWGLASPIFKLSLQNINPFTLAYFRFLGASLILFPFSIQNLTIERADWMKLIMLSFFGVTVNIIFFFYGLKYAPSINAPIIASSAPIIIYISSIFILREKKHIRVLFGLIISFLGVLTIVGQPVLQQGNPKEIIGNCFFIIAMLGAVGHAVISKELLPRYKPIVITFWSFLLGSLTFLPFFIIESISYPPVHAFDIRGWIGIVYGIFFSSTLAYLLFEWGIQKIDAQEAGIFYYIDPIAAMTLAIPILGEKITPVFLIGALLVFGGIAIAEGRIHYHPIQKLKS